MLRTALAKKTALLPAVAILLFIIPALIACNSTAAEPDNSPLVVPTVPPWGALPTRIPSPTPTSGAIMPLQILQTALLQGESGRAAQAAWEEANEAAPENSAVWREGARLALVQGHIVLAEERIWYAIEHSPEDAESWALLGVIMRQQSELKIAEQAFRVAQSLNPDIASDLFLDRWKAALRAKDGEALQALHHAYKVEHFRESLTSYYQAEALLTQGDAQAALDILLRATDESAPAIFWYTLGRTYAHLKAWNEAVITLEVAASLTDQGDESLWLTSNTPIQDLNLMLGRAYLYAGECAKAEPVLRRLSTPQPEIAPLVEAAIRCQTPTPTWTPWILSQQVTPTPTPG